MAVLDHHGLCSQAVPSPQAGLPPSGRDLLLGGGGPLQEPQGSVGGDPGLTLAEQRGQLLGNPALPGARLRQLNGHSSCSTEAGGRAAGTAQDGHSGAADAGHGAGAVAPPPPPPPSYEEVIREEACDTQPLLSDLGLGDRSCRQGEGSTQQGKMAGGCSSHGSGHNNKVATIDGTVVAEGRGGG